MESDKLVWTWIHREETEGGRSTTVRVGYDKRVVSPSPLTDTSFALNIDPCVAVCPVIIELVCSAPTLRLHICCSGPVVCCLQKMIWKLMMPDWSSIHSTR